MIRYLIAKLNSALHALRERAGTMYAGAKSKSVLDNPWFRSIGFVDVRSNANAFAGFTTVLSGIATAVQSTTQVESDSMILLHQFGSGNVNSAFCRAIEVKSISPGGFFTLGTQDGVALPRDTKVGWFILKTS